MQLTEALRADCFSHTRHSYKLAATDTSEEAFGRQLEGGTTLITMEKADRRSSD